MHMNLSRNMYYFIAILSLLNFVRILVMLIGSDLYDLRQIIKNHGYKQRKRAYRPLISVIIPAYNEEMGVIRTIDSVLANDYANRQIIVVDDGSKDQTLRMLRNYQRRCPGA